jgi:hypothetical protein
MDAPTQTMLRDEPPTVRYASPRPSPHRGAIAIAVIALIAALGALGVAIWAHQTVPAAGPSGPAGQTGPRGPQGKQGPAGTVSATQIVSPTAVVSSPDPPVGTVLVANTSCPSGKILLGGGGQVSAPGATADRNVSLRSSFPLDTTTWEAVAITSGPLGPNTSMSLKPFVVCGSP